MLNYLKNTTALNFVTRASASTAENFSRLRRDNRGIAAVEFAILAPIMIALYFGLVEISNFIHADKTVSHATNVAGDLATQISNIDSDDMEDVLEATLSTMSLRPENIGKVKVDLLSYRIDGSGNIEQIGRATLGGGVSDSYDPSEIGPRLLNAGSGAVVARMEYEYKSVTKKYVQELTTLDETFVLKPRVSPDIPFSDTGAPGEYTCLATSTIKVSCS